MKAAISICHGQFGRAKLYSLNREILTHAHLESHLIFILDGDPGWVTINNQRCQLNTSTGIAVNPMEAHSFGFNRPNSACKRLVLFLSPSWILNKSKSTARMNTFGNHEIALKLRLKNSVCQLAALLEGTRQLSRIEDLVFEIYHQCYVQSWLNEQPICISSNLIRNIAGTKVLRMIDHMSSASLSNCDLSVLANKSGLSRAQFFAKFKNEVGISPNTYLNALRMERAIHDLVKSNKTIDDIAEGLGFSSRSSFSRFFSANVGIPPGSYRRATHIK